MLTGLRSLKGILSGACRICTQDGVSPEPRSPAPSTVPQSSPEGYPDIALLHTASGAAFQSQMLSGEHEPCVSHPSLSARGQAPRSSRTWLIHSPFSSDSIMGAALLQCTGAHGWASVVARRNFRSLHVSEPAVMSPNRFEPVRGRSDARI